METKSCHIPDPEAERKRLTELGLILHGWPVRAVVFIGPTAKTPWEVDGIYRLAGGKTLFVQLRSVRSGRRRTVFSWEVTRVAEEPLRATASV